MYKIQASENNRSARKILSSARDSSAENTTLCTWQWMGLLESSLQFILEEYRSAVDFVLDVTQAGVLSGEDFLWHLPPGDKSKHGQGHHFNN